MLKFAEKVIDRYLILGISRVLDDYICSGMLQYNIEIQFYFKIGTILLKVKK